MGVDPRVMEFFPSMLDRKASDSSIEFWRNQIATRGWGLWAAENRESGEFIGFVGLQVPSTKFSFSPCVEVGWRLAFDYWGKGYATEAARGALRIGFEQLQLQEIVSFTTIAHRKSRAVMQRLGMREDPHTFQHPNLPEGHPLREHCLYRLPRDQWRAGNCQK